MKRCPFCEGEISPTAKKCKHCGEWLKGKDSEKIGKKAEKHGNKLDSGSKADLGKTIKDFLSDYWILLIIGGIILYSWLKPSNHTDNTDMQRELDNEPNGYTTETIYKIQGKGYNGYIETTESGYRLFPNQIGECDINTEDDIEKFREAVDKAENGDTINWTCPSKESDTGDVSSGKGKNIAIFLDNSYSKDLDGNLVKNGPSKRLELLGNYMNNQTVSPGSSIDFVFMFSIQPKENAEKPDDNVYHFDINPSKFEVTYKKAGKGSISYNKKKHTINRWNINLDASIGYNGKKCINNQGTDNYVCYDAESVYQEIQDKYHKDYDKDDKHTNNLLIKTLSMSKDRFLGYNKDEIFIFTDGEFEIGYEYEDIYLKKLKQRYIKERGHDQGADKDHNLADLSEENATRYQRDIKKYKSFQMEAIEALREEIPECNGVNVHIIGLTRSDVFNPLAKQIYKKIFEPCAVLFE